MKLISFITIFLLFCSFMSISNHYVLLFDGRKSGQFSFSSRGYRSINTTREKALIDFLLALQSANNGGFRENLKGSDDGGDAVSSYEVIRALYLLNSSGMMNMQLFMHYVEDSWVEWEQDGVPMGGFLLFPISDWDSKNPSVEMTVTSDLLAALWYLGKFNEFIDNDRRDRIINFIVSLYDEETGEFYVGYDDGQINSITGTPEIWRAVRALYMLNALDLIDANKVSQGIMKYYKTYNETYGVFEDEFGWVKQTKDAIKALYLLGKLDVVPVDKVVNAMKLVYDNSTGGTTDNNLDTMDTVLTVLYLLNKTSLINRNETIKWILAWQNSYKYGGFSFPINDDPNSYSSLCAIEELYYINALSALKEGFIVKLSPSPPPSNSAPNEPPPIGNPPDTGSNNDNSNNPPSNQNFDNYGFILGILIILGIVMIIASVIKLVEKNWKHVRRLIRLSRI